MKFYSNLSRSMVIASSLLLSATAVNAQGYEIGEPLDVTMNVRVKVEGNISAIDTGIDIKCDIAFDGGRRQNATATLLPVGEMFTPQTADGFMEVQVRFENLQPPEIDPEDVGALIPGELFYRCEATQADTGALFVGSVDGQLSAPNPVDVGTCPIAANYVYPQSATPPSQYVSCATVRQ